MKEEILDLVDSDDKVIGKKKRYQIDNENLNNYRVINILVYNKNGDILIGKRSNKKKFFAGCYSFPVGGHVSSGEDYEDAAYRELKEELGISNVIIKEIAHLSPKKIGTSSFSKLYKLVYDYKINYFCDEFEKMEYITREKLIENIKTKEECFTTDFVKIIKWAIKSNIL